MDAPYLLVLAPLRAIAAGVAWQDLRRDQPIGVAGDGDVSV